jgi:hypothetical protein
MPTKMLFISVALLLTACSDTEVKEWQAAAAKEPVVERSAPADFNPYDTQYEREGKAEARGKARAAADIEAADANDRQRTNAQP